jgi:hypothetical protein
MSDGIYFDQSTRTWFWEIGDQWKPGFNTELEAVQDYVTQLLDHAPELKAEVDGRTWGEIYWMVCGRG